MEITKNRQSNDTILRMIQAAFGDKRAENICELTEGMCNTAYLIEFADKSKSVLKIAAEGTEGLMRNEVNMMDAEVIAMGLARESGLVKAAEVQYYDKTRTICSGSYFFMEALEGRSFSSMKQNLTKEEETVIHYETGQLSQKLTSIRGNAFGLLGDKEHRFPKLSEFVYYLISNILADAEEKKVEIGIPASVILESLSREWQNFDSVTQPTLVHYDMWDGNIFVKDGHISGIIDWERAMWGEAFMDDRFRRHTRNPDFLRGFGKESFSGEEMRRIYWYDVLLYLVMMTEGAYRGYEDDSQYRWAKTMLEDAWGALCAP